MSLPLQFGARPQRHKIISPGGLLIVCEVVLLLCVGAGASAALTVRTGNTAYQLAGTIAVQVDATQLDAQAIQALLREVEARTEAAGAKLEF